MGLYEVSSNTGSFEQASAGQDERIVIDHAAKVAAADRYVDPFNHPCVILLGQTAANNQETRPVMPAPKPMTDEVLASLLEAGL